MQLLVDTLDVGIVQGKAADRFAPSCKILKVGFSRLHASSGVSEESSRGVRKSVVDQNVVSVVGVLPGGENDVGSIDREVRTKQDPSFR